MQRRALTIAATAMVWLAAGCAVRIRRPGAGGTNGSADPDDAVPRIAVEAAFGQVQAGKAILVDVRGARSYQARRAAGAMLLPLDEIEAAPRAALAKLPAGKQAIFYCT
ncbi:MAG: rhodanese-like domain-containing protein [Chloroflexi bacterium]|nr:rhodanese-like domain-containing protein [Chloroflexota bacterium]